MPQSLPPQPPLSPVSAVHAPASFGFSGTIAHHIFVARCGRRRGKLRHRHSRTAARRFPLHSLSRPPAAAVQQIPGGTAGRFDSLPPLPPRDAYAISTQAKSLVEVANTYSRDALGAPLAHPLATTAAHALPVTAAQQAPGGLTDGPDALPSLPPRDAYALSTHDESLVEVANTSPRDAPGSSPVDPLAATAAPAPAVTAAQQARVSSGGGSATMNQVL